MGDDRAILAGRQTPAHLALSRALWLRQRGKSYHFLFDPNADPNATPGLTIRPEPIGAEARGETGIMLVDGDEGLVFCVSSDPVAFLDRLSAWAKRSISALPALGIVADAGAARVADFAAPIDAAALDVVFRSKLWDDLLVPDEATVAAALAAASPGERLWFWMTADPGDYAVPLIVQPLAWDPNHDRMAWLMDRNADLGAGDGVTGTCALADDGAFQFLGDDVRPAMLPALADWVGAYAGDHPALARLAHARLLLTSGGTVTRVFADPDLWTDIAPEPVAGTIAGTAALLATLPEGGECWFWITGGDNAPFLHLSLASTDPDAKAFRAGLSRLYDRFLQSHADAISGVATRLSGDRMLFVSAEGDEAVFSGQIRLVLERFGDRFPALRPLAGARLLRPGATAPSPRSATPVA